MDQGSSLIADAGFAKRKRASRWPARLDLAQSASGLILALFMWGHMFFVSSILLGKDAMWTVTKLFEGYFFFGTAHPGIVSFVVAVDHRAARRARRAGRAQVPDQLPPVPHLPRPHEADAPRGHDALVLAGRHRASRCSSSRRRTCSRCSPSPA